MKMTGSGQCASCLMSDSPWKHPLAAARRQLLGIIASCLLSAGAFILWNYGTDGESASLYGSICLRLGLVLGAIWLAFPQILQIWSKRPSGTTVLIGVGVLALIAYPKSAIVMVPIILILLGLNFITWLKKPLK